MDATTSTSTSTPSLISLDQRGVATILDWIRSLAHTYTQAHVCVWVCVCICLVIICLFYLQHTLNNWQHFSEQQNETGSARQVTYLKNRTQQQRAETKAATQAVSAKWVQESDAARQVTQESAQVAALSPPLSLSLSKCACVCVQFSCDKFSCGCFAHMICSSDGAWIALC